MTDDSNPSVAMTFTEQPQEAVPIELDERALARQRRAAKLSEAKAYEAMGQRLLRFKAKKFGQVGDYIVTSLGVKKVGHGTIISASENADEYIRRCDAIVKEMLSRSPPCDPEVIVALMQLIRDFNKQLLETGEAHLRIDRQPASATEDNKFSMPFPAGTPMVIAIGKQQAPSLAPVEAVHDET